MDWTSPRPEFAQLVLEDGSVFPGRAFGAPGRAVGEVCFNTGMCGYQEILTDPSYAGQIVVMTAPQMGNYGISAYDGESQKPQVAGFVVRNLSHPSNWRSVETLHEYLLGAGIPALCDVDTRAVTRLLRERGAQRGVLAHGIADAKQLECDARAWPGLDNMDLAAVVSCRESYRLTPGSGIVTAADLRASSYDCGPEGVVRGDGLRVVVYDFGVKRNILERLVTRGCEVIVVPANTPAATALELRPHGILLSNGPGDPAAVGYGIEAVRALLGRVPVFGICLGHQILGLALGGRSFKLKFGHRGVNHPVHDLRSGKVRITSQNHGFALDPESLPAGTIEVTEVSLNDGTLEGMEHRSLPVFSVQYHPEAAPGPHDNDAHFDRFLRAAAVTAGIVLPPPSCRAGDHMPRRKDLDSVLVLGAGPIVIGQACEFDYSGTQACRALREEGVRVILVNSNPASIMTDPEIADRTYIEPLHPDYVAAILERERPRAILPTVGGQTALNLALQLHAAGILERYGVELIGAGVQAIERAENRELFDVTMRRAGLEPARGGKARTLAEAEAIMSVVGLPVIVRPSFTLGGSGGGTAHSQGAFQLLVEDALRQSPVHEVRVEECLVGWKEFELEVIRDRADNGIIICSIENFDPMGVHTGDSITIAPAMTLSDREYQIMRDQALRCIRAIGVETGGSNVQFAVNPQTGAIRIIEMNPRVSRSSALASKATGFPIARVAAKLALGYTLDEIPNDITGASCAAFEPSIDYIVVKIPRWDFEKFRGAPDLLGVQMRSVGEAMAVGRSFREALQKGLRSLEIGLRGLDPAGDGALRLGEPHTRRLQEISEALEQRGLSVAEVAQDTGIDPWFLHEMREIGLLRDDLRASGDVVRRAVRGEIDAEEKAALRDLLEHAKRDGFGDMQIAALCGTEAMAVRALRHQLGLRPVYKVVDTCAGEFAARTPYYYGTYDRENESIPAERRRVVVLGGGPNRIGQGIEFDYCCVQAVQAARAQGYEAIMVNCNPETVSTDYDIASKLYFEPLDLESVLDVLEHEKPEGVFVQFGGQTPLKLARAIVKAGFRILGTSADDIDVAEDRGRFASLCDDLAIPRPDYGKVDRARDAMAVARRIGFPVLVRPSYVLGGRAMEIVYDERTLEAFVERALAVMPDAPVLIDRFLEDAYEFDVDALSDGEDTWIAGIMQHIEEAGVHSGDSECQLPPYQVTPEIEHQLANATRRIARALNVRGLLNMQFAVHGDRVYAIEANPRASRTVPFVSKAIGVPVARLATEVALGARVRDLRLPAEGCMRGHAVKKPVFPFNKFPDASVYLGPEMRSTGEVMAWAPTAGQATEKAWVAANFDLPQEGCAYLSLNDHDKRRAGEIGRAFHDLGFELAATRGTAEAMAEAGLRARIIHKVREGKPDIVDEIASGALQVIVNTPLGRESRYDEQAVGRAALRYGVPMVTTLAGALALSRAIRSRREGEPHVLSLQERLASWHGTPAAAPQSARG